MSLVSVCVCACVRMCVYIYVCVCLSLHHLLSPPTHLCESIKQLAIVLDSFTILCSLM